MITTKELLKILSRECKKVGNQAMWARANKVSPAYVSDVLQGRREPGESIYKALGYNQVVGYEKHDNR